jgi:glutaminyl-peptide cyclotransferase
MGSYAYQTNTGEGWGIAYDGKQLVMSDGSDMLSFFDLPTSESGSTLHRVRDIRVTEASTTPSSPRNPHQGRHAINRINELEIVDGFIFANIWSSLSLSPVTSLPPPVRYVDVIVKIDPANGEIVAKYDFRDLFPHRSRPRTADCFNGIAYNASDKLFTVTGKWWPKYYRVSLQL